LLIVIEFEVIRDGNNSILLPIGIKVLDSILRVGRMGRFYSFGVIDVMVIVV